MNRKLKEKIRESFASVMPVTAVVLILATLVVPMDVGTVAMFIIGAVLLVVGMGLFSLGADMAMMPLGEGLGTQFSKTRKLWIVILVGLLVGIVITIAEPDLQVLAAQVPSIPSNVLILAVAVGVGVFLVFAILRILFKISLSHMLMVFYLLMMVLSIFVPREFLAVAFDAGGVTTGPITVPFIMALGVGLSALRSDKDASSDSFGLVALCSVGPILAVMVLGIFYQPTNAVYEAVVMPQVVTTLDVLKQFGVQLPHYAREVFTAMAPILVVWVLFQLFTRRFKRRQLARMGVGFAYTYLGLVLFLTGVNVGFLPVGHLLGSELASGASWLLIPLGMLIGYFIVTAEPAVQVLNRQVEDVTSGAIPQSAMNRCLSIGVAVSVGLAMVRVLTGISIYWIIIPGYAIALALTFFVPKIFVGIAFDSGGVASGPMTSTFLLPLAMGACEALGGNVMTDAFGIVAMVAMTPLIAVQVMGLVYKIKLNRAEKQETLAIALDGADEVIELDEGQVEETNA